MNKQALKSLQTIAYKHGFLGKITEENFNENVKTLACEFSESFGDELHKITESAAKFWELANNSGVDNAAYHYNLKKSDSLYDMVGSLVEPLGMVTDRGVGLYPTYQVTIDGQEYTEYTPLNALRRYNGFYK